MCRRHTWLRACLCYSRSHSTPTTSTKTDARQLAPSLGNHSQASNSVGTFCNAAQHTDSSCLCGDLERVSLHHHNTQISSSSSSDCPSSSSEGIRASFNLPVLHHPEPSRDYQNALPLHIQQLHAAQIYATPPSTPPLSELYDINSPHVCISPNNKHIFQYKRASSQTSPTTFPVQQENLYIETHCCSQNIATCSHIQPHQQHTTDVISLNAPFVQVAHKSIVQNSDLKPIFSVHNYHNITTTSVHNTKPMVSLEEDESNYLRPKYHFASSSVPVSTPQCAVAVMPVTASYPAKVTPHASRSVDISENSAVNNELWQGKDQGIALVSSFTIARRFVNRTARWQTYLNLHDSSVGLLIAGWWIT